VSGDTAFDPRMVLAIAVVIVIGIWSA